MKNCFKISDFNISGEPIPEDVADKILRYHIEPMNEVAATVPFEVMVSARSGYRSRKWELSKNRSGNSQHVFRGNGAVDWTCEDFESNKDEFLEALIEKTGYTRFAVYNTFIHCDYAHQIENRWVFNSKWQRIREINGSD